MLTVLADALMIASRTADRTNALDQDIRHSRFLQSKRDRHLAARRELERLSTQNYW